MVWTIFDALNSLVDNMIPETLSKYMDKEALRFSGKGNVQDDPYEVEKCARWINANALNKVCLQFPDNLLADSAEVAVCLENRIKKTVYILGDTTCGSCCVDEVAAQHVDADGIIHFGYACLNPVSRLSVFHVLPKKEFDDANFINQFMQVFADCTRTILFFYDVTYAHKVEYIYNILKPKYQNLILSTLNCESNVKFTDKQQENSVVVLGRIYTIENDSEEEGYEAVFLGENEKTFTSLALSIPAKKWYYFKDNNIISFEASNMRWLKQRRYLIEKLKDAKVIGIVVATLGIKEYLKAVIRIKNILKEKNKKSYILSVGKLNPTKLANFPEIDAFVVISCPGNEVFDSRDFLRPVLMPYEVELAFNSSRGYSSLHCMDFRQILPGGLHYVDFTVSKDSDVSLITGDLRTNDVNTSCAEKMNAVAITSTGTVAIGKAGAQYLQNRSWRGVEQRLGEDTVQSAEIGRSGIPNCYENENLTQKEYNKFNE
ncbi:hypothetical protein KM043_015962 [Ampulex compressa]|nr:hypothetical protein KM043_015962 [Ampulex compressa]